MRAAVADAYGPPEVVRLTEVARPDASTGEVLVRVQAAAVTSGDSRIRGARFPPGFGLGARLAFGITRPRRRILGAVFAGVVETAGPGVDDLVPGRAVGGMTGMRLGAHAEYVPVPRDRLARLPEGLSMRDAAGVLFGGTTALFLLRDRVEPGRSVLVTAPPVRWAPTRCSSRSDPEAR